MKNSKADQYRKTRLGNLQEANESTTEEDVKPGKPDVPLRGESFTHTSLNTSPTEVMSGCLIIMVIAIAMVVGAIAFVNFAENRRTGEVGSEDSRSVIAGVVMPNAISERLEQRFEMGPS